MNGMNLESILSVLKDKYGMDVLPMTREERQQQLIDLYNNSVGNLNESDGYDCEICKNKGYIARLDENGYEIHTDCQCRKIRATIRRINRSGLGDMINKCKFDNYIVTEPWQKFIKETAEAFCHDYEAKWFYIGGQVGCVDCDTEYFNGTGWKKISEYKNGEKVLQYNPYTKQGTLVLPKRYIVKDAETLYHISTGRKHIDMVLSDDHNFAYVTTKGHMNKKPFSEVMKIHEETTQGFYGRVETAFTYSFVGIDLTDNEIRLMCAVIADGSFRKNLRLCSVNIKKERKKQRMRMLLKGTQYKEYQKKDGYSEFRFYAPRREKEFTDFWYGCNNSQLQVISDEVFYWDGSTDGKRKSFFSTSKKSADFVQFALSATGSRATIEVDTHREKPCYVVIKTSYSSKVSMCSTGGKNKAVIKPYKPKDGRQYCFTVDSGYLIFRRNGRIFITGNCGKTHLCTAIATDYIKKGYELRYMLWIDDSKMLKSLANDFAYQDKINIYKNVDVLYIDDFLKVKQGGEPTTADIVLAFEILNSRVMDDEKVTIISSEKTIDELLDYDEAMMSRIVQKCGRYKLNIGKDRSKNYRLK